MIDNQTSKIYQEKDNSNRESTSRYYAEYKQDIFVLNFAEAKKIASINNLKTPKLHELTDRGIKLVAQFSGMKYNRRKLAEAHTICEVYRSVDMGDCGFDFISRN